jgi:multicomponent K+:H+ antiporter subunit F
MLNTVLPIAMGAFVLALALSAWRLLRGPGLADRVLALDALYVNTLALLVLMGIGYGTTLYFEVALVIAMLGFVGTVVLSKFLAQGDISR